MSGVRRFRLPRWLQWGAGLAATVFAIEYFVLPQIAGARNALHTLGDVKPAYLVIGTALEILSVVAYAALTRSVLPAKGRPSFWTLLRIDTTTLGISHIVPGGAATASAVRFRLLHVHGVAGPDAALGAAVQGVGSAIVLNVLLWIGLVVSIPVRGFNPLYTTAAIVGAALLASGVVAVILLTRGQESSVRFVRAVARRIPYLTEDTVERYVRIAAARLRELAKDRRMLVQAVVWATLNWLLDAAALWVFIAAYG
ncbi:MAG TPA: lysylphosphatidylglycerol synthase domain-containing protein, partial [Mycobacteriales bacterium]|nr:lysylphosphatidylglycerol synthase domain-containing protein [Mycobacteriales bacterium]